MPSRNPLIFYLFLLLGFTTGQSFRNPYQSTASGYENSKAYRSPAGYQGVYKGAEYTAQDRFHPSNFIYHQMHTRPHQQLQQTQQQLQASGSQTSEISVTAPDTHVGEVQDSYTIPEQQPHEQTNSYTAGYPSSGYRYPAPPPPSPPPFHEHHHHHMTEPPPAVEKPKQDVPSYTYYHLGRHLWYIPLYFSVYFIIYVGALVLKAVAKHKIQFPVNLQEAVSPQAKVLDDIHTASKRYYMR